MEIHLFKTDDVEEKLDEALSSLKILSYAFHGLSDLHSIDDEISIAFNKQVNCAMKNIKELLYNMEIWGINVNPSDIIDISEKNIPAEAYM